MPNVAPWSVSYAGFRCNPTHAKCFMSEHIYWILWVVERGQIHSPWHHPHPFWWCHFLLWKERAAPPLSSPLQLPFSPTLMLSNLHLSFTAWTCPWGFHPLPPGKWAQAGGWRLEGGWSSRSQASRLSEGPPSLLCASDSSWRKVLGHLHVLTWLTMAGILTDVGRDGEGSRNCRCGRASGGNGWKEGVRRGLSLWAQWLVSILSHWQQHSSSGVWELQKLISEKQWGISSKHSPGPLP